MRMPYRILCNGTKQKSSETRSGLALTSSRFTPLHKIRYGIVMTTKRRSRSTAKATADVITVTTGVAISSNNPDAITACDRSISKPDHTCANVWGNVPKSILCAVSPPGCSNRSSTPTRMIVVLKITPTRSIHPMIVEVRSFAGGFFFGLARVVSIAGCDSAIKRPILGHCRYLNGIALTPRYPPHGNCSSFCDIIPIYYFYHTHNYKE